MDVDRRKTGGKKLKEKQWDARYQELVEYKEKHGTATVSIDGLAEDHPLVKLNKWCQTKRDDYNGTGSCRMTEPRRMKLNKIGFCWDLYEATWQAWFEGLKKFKNTNGHVNVPKANDLYRFIEYQRIE